MAKGDRAGEHGQDLILLAHDLAERIPPAGIMVQGVCSLKHGVRSFPKSGLFVRQSKCPLRAILQTSPPYRV